MMALCWGNGGNCASVSDMFTSLHYELITSSGLSVWAGWDMHTFT